MPGRLNCRVLFIDPAQLVERLGCRRLGGNDVQNRIELGVGLIEGVYPKKLTPFPVSDLDLVQRTNVVDETAT